MTDAELVPVNWVCVRLGDVVKSIRPRHKPAEYPDLEFVGMDNVEAHSTRLLGTVPAATMKSSATHFQPGDVLYGRLRPYLNKVISPGFEGLASAEFVPLTPEDGVLADLIKYRLNAADFVAFTSSLDTGDRPRVDYEQISAFQFRLPPTVEQHRIVDAIESYLTRLDAAIASLERVEENLKRYRASVLKAAVEGRLVPTEAELARQEGRGYEPASELLKRILVERKKRWIEDAAEKARAKAEAKARKAGKPWTPEDDAKALQKARKTAEGKYREPQPPDTSDLPNLPEGWCWAATEQLLVQPLINGRSVPTSQEGFDVLRLTSLTDGRVDLHEKKTGAWSAEEASPFLVAEGDIFLARGNGSIRLVGIAGLVDVAPSPVAFPDTMIRIRLLPESLLPRLFVRLWNSRVLRDLLEPRAKTTAGIHKVNQKDVSTMPIPVAPLAEQKRLLEAIETHSSATCAVSQSASQSQSRAAALRQSILKWAFEGNLVEQDPNDEPASVLLDRIRADRLRRQR